MYTVKLAGEPAGASTQNFGYRTEARRSEVTVTPTPSGPYTAAAEVKSGSMAGRVRCCLGPRSTLHHAVREMYGEGVQGRQMMIARRDVDDSVRQRGREVSRASR